MHISPPTPTEAALAEPAPAGANSWVGVGVEEGRRNGKGELEG